LNQLSHIYERFVEESYLCNGVPIGFSCGDNLRFLEDIQILKPTVSFDLLTKNISFTYIVLFDKTQVVALVPRVLNRVYQAIKSATVDAPGAKGMFLLSTKALFHAA
jgi:long-chain acyl-CoA synthetase